MEDKKIMKNMEYWKKKNNIPGIKALESAGLTDGRAGSAPFQMNTSGDSSNKGFVKNALNPFMGGPIGAFWRSISGPGNPTMGAMGASAANTAQQVPAYNPVQQPVQQPVQVPVQGSAVAMEKSPMEQEEDRKTIAGQYITRGKDADGKESFYYDTGGDDQIYIEDPKGLLKKYKGFVEDYDFSFEETEDGYYRITDVDDAQDVDPDAPGTPGTPGFEPPVKPRGGVGKVKGM